MTTNVDDFLEHYGVKGMKWGVRKTPLRGRVNAAAADRVHNRIKSVKRMQGAGQKGGFKALTAEEKVTYAASRVLRGKKLTHKVLDNALEAHEARAERIAVGRKSLADRLDNAMSTSIVDLALSVRDES